IYSVGDGTNYFSIPIEYHTQTSANKVFITVGRSIFSVDLIYSILELTSLCDFSDFIDGVFIDCIFSDLEDNERASIKNRDSSVSVHAFFGINQIQIAPVQYLKSFEHIIC